MDKEKLLKVIEFYIGVLQNRGISPKKWPSNKRTEPLGKWEHCLYTLNKMKKRLKRGEVNINIHLLDLCSVQTVLWSTGMFSLRDLNKHVRIKSYV